jgi:hypothetical protein
VKNATLPQRDTDKVLTLYAHYFLAGELMLKNYRKLDKKWSERGRLSPNDRHQMSIYFFTWLGFLAVTAEGFQKKLAIRRLLQDERPPEFAELIPMADELGKMLKKNDDALRKVRNSVFHLRESTEEIERFFHERPGRLGWAEDLQAVLENFFSDYRVLCQVHYVIGNRKDEFFK